ncbi:mutator type transposase [Tanacetum coccineum]
MNKLSREQPASSMARPIVVDSVVDPFDGLDEILSYYANTRNESTWKQMVVHIEEESDTEGNDTSGSDSEDLDYDPKHDDVFDDDEHIVKEVHVIMNNFSFTTDPKHDTSIDFVDVQEDDLDVIDFDSFGSNLDGQQFASKEIVKGRVKKHSIETRRQLILVKNDNERVRVRCEGTIPTLVPYVAIDTNTDKNVFSQTKCGPAIRENNNSGKQNILGKDKTVKGKDKKIENHVIKSLATNPDIPVRAVQDQMQKQFEVGVSKMKAFREKRIASDIMTCSYREQYSLLREYAKNLSIKIQA